MTSIDSQLTSHLTGDTYVHISNIYRTGCREVVYRSLEKEGIFY